MNRAITVAAMAALALMGGAACTTQTDTPTPTSVVEYAGYCVPNAETDCIDLTDMGYAYVNRTGNRADHYVACEYEDSNGPCVWDAATQGNRSESVDSPRRFVIVR